MDFIALYKIGALKDVKKLYNLPLNEKFAMLEVSCKNTKFGRSILVDLGDFKVWLPTRYNSIFNDKAIEEFNEKFKKKMYLTVLEIKLLRNNKCPVIEIDFFPEYKENK